MKKILVPVTALTFAAFLLSACSDAPNDSSGKNSANGVDYLACMVSDSGGFDDESFNQSSYNGLVRAKDELGIKIKTIESKSSSDYVTNLQSTLSAGCSITFTVGHLFADATQDFAVANPDRNIVIIDDDQAGWDPLGNLKTVTYNTAEAAFLGGYLSAQKTNTGAVGTFGGMNIPAVKVFMDGFARGVSYYNEEKSADVRTLGWDMESRDGTFVGNFEDQARAKQIAQNILETGVLNSMGEEVLPDIIMPVAGQASKGAVSAVRNSDASLIWVDTDGRKTIDGGENIVLASVMKMMDQSVFDIISNTYSGEFDSTPYVGDLKNGGVALAAPDSLLESLETIKQSIISGDIVVSFLQNSN